MVGIQVFQHGNRAQAHRHIRAAPQRVEPDGLFCLRVNAIGTDLWPAPAGGAPQPVAPTRSG